MTNGKWKMTNGKCFLLHLPPASCRLPPAPPVSLGIDEAIKLLRPVLIEILQNIVLLQRGVAIAHG